MLGDGEAEEHAATLGHVGDAELGACGRRALGDVVAVDADRARHRPDEAGHRPQRRRLAGTVGAEQRHHLAGVDVEVEVAHDRRRVVAGGQRPSSSSTGLVSHRSNAFVSLAAEPRYAATTLRVGAHVARRADRDHLAELEHDDAVADPEHEAHVVVDQEDRRAAVDDLAQVTAERDRLVGVESGGRLVEAEQLGPRRQRAGDGDELALALGQLARRRLGERLEREQLERLVDRVGDSATRLVNMSLSVVSNDGWWAATVRFSRTVRSSNSSIACHVRARPRRARACGLSSVMSAPSSVGRAAVRHEPGDGVDERRLAGAVRADQPDQLAGLDVEVDVDDGVHAAERDGDRCGRRGRWSSAHPAS